MSDTTTTDAEAPDVCGRLTVEQYYALASPINPNRVREHDDGSPWLEGADVKRWLTRIFGYCGWGRETLHTVVHAAVQVSAEHDDESRLVWQVTRETTVRLTVRAQDGTVLTTFDGTAVCTMTRPVLGEAHNDATNTAETNALKRAARDLSDVFGLGLAAGVLLKPYIGGSLTRPDGTAAPAWAAQEDEPDPVPDCVPAGDVADDAPRAPVTAAEGARLVAAASRRAIDTTRPIGDLAEALQASIARARKARDAAALVSSP